MTRRTIEKGQQSIQRDVATTSMIKATRFECWARNAQAVYLVGDFNDWDPTSHPMRLHENGRWVTDIPLRRGRIQYQFLIDGRPTLDPATGVGRSQWNDQVSLLDVS